MEKILCAAIYVDTGKEEAERRYDNYPQTGKIFLGYRHADCLISLNAWKENLTQKEADILNGIDSAGLRGRHQGFLTSTGRFVDRVEAFLIAKVAGQIITKREITFLTSEDIY